MAKLSDYLKEETQAQKKESHLKQLELERAHKKLIRNEESLTEAKNLLAETKKAKDKLEEDLFEAQT